MERDLRDPTKLGEAFLNELAALRIDGVPRGKGLSHRERVVYAASVLGGYDIPDYAAPAPVAEQGGHRRLT